MPRASFFLKITPQDGDPIPGEAEEEEFSGQIEVSSWDWSVSDKKAKDMMSHGGTQAAAGAGASQGAPAAAPSASRHGEAGEKSCQPTPVRFSKTTDRSTVRLLKAMYNDEKFKEARFTLQQRTRAIVDGTEKEQVFRLELVLTKARVTSFDFNVRTQHSDVEFDENWEFSYDLLHYDLVAVPGLSKGPGPSVDFGPPDSKTQAPGKPQMSQAEVQRSLEQQRVDNERQRAEIERLRREQKNH